MIAVSSHRPLAQSAEYMRNQLLAHSSWEEVFDQIVYFGEPQQALDGDTTVFIDSEEFPRIKTLMEVAACQKGWSALINADIVVGIGLPRVEQELYRRRAQAAVSRRWQFELDDDSTVPKVVDLGLDFFAASPGIWQEAVRCVPDIFRIGHCRWDSWMLGFLNATCLGACFDITPSMVIFHPRHGDRKQIYEIPPGIGEEYAAQICWPTQQIAVGIPVPL